jgi:trehalose 6-phosphate synthase
MSRAARALTEALIVHRNDLDDASAAAATTRDPSVEEQRDRIRATRALAAAVNACRWAGWMIVDAARSRSRDRLTGRLTGHLVSAPVHAEP